MTLVYEQMSPTDLPTPTIRPLTQRARGVFVALSLVVADTPSTTGNGEQRTKHGPKNQAMSHNEPRMGRIV